MWNWTLVGGIWMKTAHYMRELRAPCKWNMTTTTQMGNDMVDGTYISSGPDPRLSSLELFFFCPTKALTRC